MKKKTKQNTLTLKAQSLFEAMPLLSLPPEDLKVSGPWKFDFMHSEDPSV